ncbi:MAG: hypothetical protein HYX87_01460 [Chloroflexi bacterium]|nr:hypothetical protein [Chloroflexota bacterium]
MKRMKGVGRLFAVASAVVITLMVLTAGIVQAGWEWCDDPIISIGNSTVNISFLSDGGTQNYSSSVTVTVPEGVTAKVLDAQGSSVTLATSNALKVKNNSVQVAISALVTGPAGDESGIKVQVTANGRVLGQAVGKVGQEIMLTVGVPTR